MYLSEDYTSIESNSIIIITSSGPRMITGKEVVDLGCSISLNTCPSWMKGTFWIQDSVLQARKTTSYPYSEEVNASPIAIFNDHLDPNDSDRVYGIKAVIGISKSK